MAGHSKWANIQHRKKKVDAKRGKVFTKLIRLVTVAARLGGADLQTNPRLREAVNKAKAANMPNDTIERAIKKGVGDTDSATMEEVIYEGYGPEGVAVMVECLTDNRNRTVAEVRHVFNKYDGNLGTNGSVAYLFSQQGQFGFSVGCDETAVTEIALEENVVDISVNEDGSIDIVTTTQDFFRLKQIFDQKGLQAEYAEISQAATTNVPLNGEAAEKCQKLIEALEDLDDVQNVYSNVELPDDMFR